MTFVLVVAATIPVTATSAAPELRWIAYVRAKEGSYSSKSGPAVLVRSDGRKSQTIDERIQSLDLGSAGLVYAVLESADNSSGKSSIVIGSVSDTSLEQVYPDDPDISYAGVAAAPNGAIAIGRHIRGPQKTPGFLAEGVEVLRSTMLPILVPPEEPEGTIGLVPSAEEEFYRLLFTNDPAGELAHAAQVNIFVEASTQEFEVPGYGAQPMEVRGSDGRFFCGASTCFLTWTERAVSYLVGEFGVAEEAVSFAESLVPIEHVAGSRWKEGDVGPIPTPELIVRSAEGKERILDSMGGFCVCGFRPLDWSPGSDRLLALKSADGNFSILQFRADGSGEPVTVDERGLPGVIFDAAYGPNGVVSLFGEQGTESTILRQPGGTGAVITSSDAGSFDIGGSTLAYINASREVIVRDMSTGTERTVGEGAIDVSVAPDLIAGSGSARTNAGRGNGGLPVVLLVVIGLAGVALVTGAARLLIARRRRLD